MSDRNVGQAAASDRGAIRAAGLERAAGEATVAVGLVDGASRLRALRHSGAAKCFLPRTHERAPVAVLVNTAGGLAGGDRFSARMTVEAGASLTVTTQAAERVYRAVDATPARMEAALRLDAGARLFWLPQETILFDGGRLERRLDVDMAPDARLLVVEQVTLGRGAMGETTRDGFLSDQWRARRGGALVFAEALRLAAPIDTRLAAAATGGGARALLTLLYAAPDAEDRLRAARAALPAAPWAETGLDAGASAWNDLLFVRAVALDPSAARRAARALVERVTGEPPPRFWSL